MYCGKVGMYSCIGGMYTCKEGINACMEGLYSYAENKKAFPRTHTTHIEWFSL